MSVLVLIDSLMNRSGQLLSVTKLLCTLLSLSSSWYVQFIEEVQRLKLEPWSLVLTWCQLSGVLCLYKQSTWLTTE